MKKHAVARAVVAASVIGFCGLSLPAARAAQFGRQTQPPSTQEKEMMARQAREANKKRQQDLRDDTDKLFQLAGELKAAVDKSNEDVLSLDVMRKAAEVEKLAKKVKEKMRDSVGPPAIQQLPPPPPIPPQ